MPSQRAIRQRPPSPHFRDMYRGLFHGPGLVVILRAHLDAGGVSLFGHRYIAVAGFLSSPRRFDQAEQQWRKTLKQYGAKNFHAAAFRSGKASPYRSWSEGKRASFEGLLRRLICRRTILGVAIGASLTDYEALDAATKERLGGNPYGLCAMRAIWEVSKVINRSGLAAQVAYIFETGGTDEGPWIAAMQDLGVASPTFKAEMRIHTVTPMTKEQAKVFDMADLLAWEATHHAPKQFGISKEPMSEALEEIRRGVQIASDFYDGPIFREIAHRNTPEFLAFMRKEYGLNGKGKKQRKRRRA